MAADVPRPSDPTLGQARTAATACRARELARKRGGGMEGGRATRPRGDAATPAPSQHLRLLRLHRLLHLHHGARVTQRLRLLRLHVTSAHVTSAHVTSAHVTSAHACPAYA